ncbi:MAG TPA: 4-hydroxy-tetrahydrodipicolinate synthase [Niabella sp.]|mgnify:CR=1 FL=1|nr:4-hydroxy-tetrahydrodipicolinate synthase [Niabella sp.]HOZ97320.1 4-hydroxy-tetrahydrodipicolinate synthase [Niabella sp.]HQW15409.1 4-hydroxy-tetrahydrodipicolinate synthase [Niabella sp.]HQX20545.1 4-hydroxy-tetrahydrodipicolinate synthase [Niabella sp.]HQX41077.1 4-hydroxy-tetrahydrodipicolinate synthase [Niabella sp.]
MSLQQKFRGTGIAIVTPFTPAGDFDWPALEKLVNFWIDNKVEYLVVAGTTGESATLTREEEQVLFSFVAEKNEGRVPLVAGIGGNDTREILEAFKKMNVDGYDAILSVSPYYNKPRQEGIFQQYKAINDAAPLPVIMYNVPGRTGMNVTAETTLRVAEECKNIFATKEASGNFDQLNQIMKYKPKDFMLISGDDGISLPMIALGAEGVISVVANAYPKEFSEMIRLCLKGDFAQASTLHLKYIDIINSMFADGSPSGVKQYLSEMGLCGTNFRLPIVPVSDEHAATIRELMAKL